jgi:hypothetical protein
MGGLARLYGKGRQRISLHISDRTLGYGVINSLLNEGIQDPYQKKDLICDGKKENKRCLNDKP